MKNPKRSFINNSKLVLVAAAAAMATNYAIHCHQETERKDKIKAKIENLKQQNDSIKHANINTISRLCYELDVCSTMVSNNQTDAAKASGKTFSDSIRREISNAKNDAARKIACNKEEIIRLTNELTR